MVNSFVANRDLDSEMTVVRNEFEAGENNPLGVLYQRVLSTAYLWHNYGKSVIGSRADIENVPIDRLQAFYRTYYQPDNAILVVAGKIDEPRTLALVETKKASNVGGTSLQLREAGIWLVLSDVRKESSLEDARDTLLGTIDGIRTTPFTAEEVERSRNRLLTGIELALNNSEQVALQLSNWASMGDWRLLFLNRDRIKAATVADIQRVAVQYTKPANRTVGIFRPEDKPDRAEIPAAQDLVALLKDYRGSAAASAKP